VGITTAVIHLSDTAAAFVAVIAGPPIALFGALVSDSSWDRWYGNPQSAGRFSAPLLRRLPRAVSRASLIVIGVAMTVSGALLFALSAA
jgi:hypothetical protein